MLNNRKLLDTLMKVTVARGWEKSQNLSRFRGGLWLNYGAKLLFLSKCKTFRAFLFRFIFWHLLDKSKKLN